MANRPIIKSHSSFPPTAGRPNQGFIRAHRNNFVTAEDESRMFEQAAQEEAQRTEAERFAQFLPEEPVTS